MGDHHQIEHIIALYLLTLERPRPPGLCLRFGGRGQTNRTNMGTSTKDGDSKGTEEAAAAVAAFVARNLRCHSYRRVVGYFLDRANALINWSLAACSSRIARASASLQGRTIKGDFRRRGPSKFDGLTHIANLLYG